jgi:hypothetical protein
MRSLLDLSPKVVEWTAVSGPWLQPTRDKQGPGCSPAPRTNESAIRLDSERCYSDPSPAALKRMSGFIMGLGYLLPSHQHAWSFKNEA